MWEPVFPVVEYLLSRIGLVNNYKAIQIKETRHCHKPSRSLMRHYEVRLVAISGFWYVQSKHALVQDKQFILPTYRILSLSDVMFGCNRTLPGPKRFVSYTEQIKCTVLSRCDRNFLFSVVMHVNFRILFPQGGELAGSTDEVGHWNILLTNVQSMLSLY